MAAARALSLPRAPDRVRPPERPANALGYLPIMFAVDDIEATLGRLTELGAQLVGGEVVRYGDAYRLCYIRAPDGLLVGLAEEIG